MPESAWEQPGRRRVRPLGVGLGAVLVAVGLVLAVVSPADRGGRLPVEEEEPRPPQPAGEDPRRTPFPRPSGYGVAPAPAPGEGWRWLPDAPIRARLEPLSVWTGEEFVVWGGTVDGDAAADGAAYSPDRDSWRRLSDAPATMSAATAAATWTGEEVVVWGGTADERVAAAYDPAVDRWRTLPDAPVGPDGGAPTVAWTGTEVIVWATGGAGYDPVRDRWRALPVAPVEDIAADGAHVSAWTDDPACDGCGALLVWMAPAEPGDDWSGAAYDPAGDQWVEVASATLPMGGAGLTATWTGETVVLCCSLGGEDALGVYDPAADAWLQPVEGPVARRSLHTAVWIDGELLVWGGRQDRDRWLRGNGVAWEPATRRWRWLAEASPRIPRQLHAAAWTGRELLVWGGYDGREARGDGAALDPSSGRAGRRAGPPVSR